MGASAVFSMADFLYEGREWYDRKQELFMTVRLDWPPDVVDRLTEEARQRGLSLDEFVLQTVLEKKSTNGIALSDEAAKRQAREEAGRSIRELRRGNILGPDLTTRDLIEEGRRF